jgi:hypothetical protein
MPSFTRYALKSPAAAAPTVSAGDLRSYEPKTFVALESAHIKTPMITGKKGSK